MGKITDRIRAARSQPEAMLALAEGIDEILNALASSPVHPPEDDQWGNWAERNATGAASAGESGFGSDAHPFEAVQVKVDPRELEEAREDQRQAEINWERINAAGRQEGQTLQDWQDELVLARDAMARAQGRVRLLEDPGAIVQGGRVIVDLPPVDAKRQAARRKLAEAVGLPGFFPSIFRTGEPAEQIIHSFELGGPLWLNANGKFEGQPPVIMQMPANVRQAMVADVMLDSPRLGHEFAREVLKDYDELGNMQATGDNIDSVVARGGQPYQGKGDA
jgi:hypothetical protein